MHATDPDLPMWLLSPKNEAPKQQPFALPQDKETLPRYIHLDTVDAAQLTLQEEFLEKLFALATTCIQQRLQESRPFVSPLVHFLAIMGIDEGANKLRRPQTYTRVLAGMFYVNRLLALEFALPQQPWPSLDLAPAAQLELLAYVTPQLECARKYAGQSDGHPHHGGGGQPPAKIVQDAPDIYGLCKVTLVAKRFGCLHSDEAGTEHVSAEPRVAWRLGLRILTHSPPFPPAYYCRHPDPFLDGCCRAVFWTTDDEAPGTAVISDLVLEHQPAPDGLHTPCWVMEVVVSPSLPAFNAFDVIGQFRYASGAREMAYMLPYAVALSIEHLEQRRSINPHRSSDPDSTSFLLRSSTALPPKAWPLKIAGLLPCFITEEGNFPARPLGRLELATDLAPLGLA
ncbi:MAG: hypothetical protein M1826_007529 [Phylliscum demangeonii]|nr:MAG: hypothetical protein M1826_007529 [Phylliscum demangeonii]